MYVALFLFPWLLMYALSTAVMNHRTSFASSAPGGAPVYEKERELTYDGVFPEDAELRTISQQILLSVDLDGAHGVTRRKDGAIVITRNDLLTPRRLTYTPATRVLTIEPRRRRRSWRDDERLPQRRPPHQQPREGEDDREEDRELDRREQHLGRGARGACASCRFRPRKRAAMLDQLVADRACLRCGAGGRQRRLRRGPAGEAAEGRQPRPGADRDRRLADAARARRPRRRGLPGQRPRLPPDGPRAWR